MTHISLCEGWNFCKIPEKTMDECAPGALPVEGWETVDLPHTWYTDEDQYRGLTAYCRTITWGADKTRAFLSFEGADQRCRVYADGELLGEHRGGYSTFRYLLERPESGETQVTVLLDNRLDETISPHFGDFTIFGGLYRPVSLIEVGECSFDYGYYGTNGLIVRAALDEIGNGLMHLEPHTLGAEGAKIRYSVLDPLGSCVLEELHAAEETVTLRVKSPKLWNGKKEAPLYIVRAELLRDANVADAVEIRTGFRRLALSADEGFSLNGEKTYLSGVAKHQDIAASFNAVTDEEILHDFEMIGEIGANAVRLSHYQHAQTAYDKADEMGLLAWTEIPMLKMTEDQALFENAQVQLKELILQNIHHPSIFCWGIQNEIAMFRDAPFMHEQCRVLDAIIKALDPGRYCACANLYPLKPKSKLNHITDLVGYNIYFGWYYGQMEDYATYLDRFHAAAPDVCLGVSEYGVDCNLALHSETPHLKDYSEEYQALWHEKVYPQLEERPWLWGSFIWNMFDFSSARRNEGGLRFVNGKGLVTRDRKIKKDAFYYYKARWSEEPFVHLCARRFEKRWLDAVDVKVYSNQQSITLFVNGAEFGTAENDGNGTVVFQGVPLIPGENKVEACAGELRDSLVWQKVDAPEASYALPDSGDGTVKNWFLSDDDITRQGYFSINDTANDVMDDAKARAVLEKYIPGMVKVLDSGVVPMGLTLKNILNYNKDISQEVIKTINGELNQIENLF